MKRILIVEDDLEIAGSLLASLTTEGYEVISVRSAEEAHIQVKKNVPDMILLDIMLPGETGMSFFQTLGPDINPAVIMVTALGEPIDNIIALEMGVDDYVTKPFHMNLLLAKIRSTLRKKTISSDNNYFPSNSDTTISFSSFLFYPLRKYLRDSNGTRISLTSSESNLLFFFIQNKGKILSREELMGVINNGSENSLRSIDILVSRLRKKLITSSNNELLIETIRKSGYLFNI